MPIKSTADASVSANGFHPRIEYLLQSLNKSKPAKMLHNAAFDLGLHEVYPF